MRAHSRPAGPHIPLPVPAGPHDASPDGMPAGRYRLDTLIGRGGAADVYRGLDLRLRRPVAVKVFRPGADTEMEERFSDEALLLARLQHPGLVTVYDAGQHEGGLYLVMQLVEGATLRQRLAAGPRGPRWVAGVGTALASALAHVHAAGIVHRDVKPGNVLLDRADNPHLTDFGISRLLDAPAQTDRGTLLGTAAYMAPEQVLGHGTETPADIYALGLVLLECLKGELEYDGAPLEAATARLLRAPVVPPSVPGSLAGLLTAMTAHDPAERPDAESCAEVLAAACREAALPGPPPAGASRTGAGPSRVGARLPLPAPRAPGTTARAQRQPGAAPRTHAPARSRRVLLATGTTLAAVLGVTLTASDSGHSGTGGRATSRQAGQLTPQDAPTGSASSSTGSGATTATPLTPAPGGEAGSDLVPTRSPAPSSRGMSSASGDVGIAAQHDDAPRTPGKKPQKGMGKGSGTEAKRGNR